jgi:regulator of replication initiation timing
MDIERAFETYIEHEKPSGWEGWTAQNMLNAFKAGAEAMETVEADVDRLKIELENACRERNELKAENTQLKEALKDLLVEAKYLYQYYPNFRQTAEEYFADEIKAIKAAEGES